MRQLPVLVRTFANVAKGTTTSAAKPDPLKNVVGKIYFGNQKFMIDKN